MEMAIVAARQHLKSARFCLEELIIREALFLPDDQPTQVQLVLRPTEPNHDFSIYSLDQTTRDKLEALLSP